MSPRNRAALTLAVGVAGLALGWPASGQQSPESLLPPGFGMAPPPPPASARPGEAPPAAPPAVVAVPPSETVPPDTAAEQALPPPPAPEELPEAPRRDVGLVGQATGGEAAFGDADGRYLATLMRRLQTPIASRWAEIMLRRVLVGRTPAPPGEGSADWVADRASLLLRLGEADAARLLVQGVDAPDYSPRLRRVAIRAALATSDPAGLCPIRAGGEEVGGQPAWPMIRSMCAALGGDAATANATIGRGPPGDPVDHPLAEKVVAASGGGRRAVTIEWAAVDQLTDWRFGLATALNVLIPQALVDAAPAWMQAWLARAPMLAAADRVAPARVAAATGPMSSYDLVDLYGRVMDEAGQVDPASAPARLRAAYRASDDAGRLEALRSLWQDVRKSPDAITEPDERDRYAATILTARAAAGLTPSRGDGVADLLAAMLSAGLDRQAERWAPYASDDRAWALLAVGATRAIVPVDARRVQAYADRAGSDGRFRAAMLAAALAGLGRLPGADAAKVAESVGVPIGGTSPYARVLQRAVTDNQPGTVALLVAVGMQSPRWAGVPAADFYRMIAALRAVGMEGEARMIAAEAMTRLS